MKGMDLSKKYYNEVLKPIIDKFGVPVAVGLIGYGSECYGYDDNISRDHDFSAMPSIWLRHDDYLEHGERLKVILKNLPTEFEGCKVLDESVWGKNRRGILDIDEYIYSFLGSNTAPSDDIEYRNIPQYLLSAFTNGEIFRDDFGIITSIREKVKFYPKDIKYNMMATRCMNMNSSYINYERCIKRNEYVAANQALSLFITASIEMYFLINEKYCPYYKWQHRMLGEIDENAYNLFNDLVKPETTYSKKINIMDEICSDIIDKLEDKDIVIRIADFIGYYGPVIQSRIKNEAIKELGCWRD